MSSRTPRSCRSFEQGRTELDIFDLLAEFQLLVGEGGRSGSVRRRVAGRLEFEEKESVDRLLESCGSFESR